ncbi:hypothetical protein [Streptomyces xanthochromogenes]|uniref:hypothetical protein n=1 Tax=Streptomyces xanthochromogenes TaxID=67384 RepID=UPI002F3FDD4D
MRVTIAAAVSAAAGAAAGAVASSCGLDVVDSVKVGGVVSGAVGNILYQVLRLTPDQRNVEGGESDNVNASGSGQVTAAPSIEAGAQAPSALDADGTETVTSDDTTTPGSRIPGQRCGDGHDGLQERKNRGEEDGHGAS